MGQPEMQPERPPQDGRGEGAAGLRPGDLTGRAFPLGDWAEPAQRLDELFRWVERGALDTAAWYLADRVWKRRAGRGHCAVARRPGRWWVPRCRCWI
ncbi:hypothetical protein RKD49_004278 [Streptomyces glaucescens]